MKTKTTTNDVIEAVKSMIQYSRDAKPIIAGICRSHRITPDFIREFHHYIDSEMFMTSYRLSRELAESNPSLYNEDDFKNLCKYNSSEITEGEEERVKTNNIKNISISMLALFYNEFRNSSEYSLSEEDIKNIIRDSTDEEMIDESLINLMGISADIDDLLLKRIKDEEIRSNLLLALSLNDDHKMTSASYKYLSNDIKEKILGTEDVPVPEFLSALSESNDLGWQSKMIGQLVKDEITFEKTNGVYEKELLMLIARLPEDLIVDLASISKYAPNTFSYKIMLWLVDNKDFDEDQLIRMLPLFKKAGLYFVIKKMASQNNYEKLLSFMK